MRHGGWLRGVVSGCAWLCFGPWALCASDLDEFKVKREEVFEFAQKPSVVRKGDRIEIGFESKGRCDATVAIENAEGQIIRHLASGVLGPKPPEPFQKNELKQTVLWDGKDDQGKYVDDKDRCTVRVSLGLQPQFERTLFWSPSKRVTEASLPIFKACPEGVLVYEGQIYDNARLYDHDGNYLRTVYPFPAEKVRQIADLHWFEFPQDGAKLPLKEWFRQATLLTSGENSNHPFRGYGEQRMDHDGHGAGAAHRAASAMAVAGRRVALAMLRMNRLATDGSSGGLKLNGPAVSYEVVRGGLSYLGANDKVQATPTSAALSPDGKWLYLTGYTWIANFGTGGKKNFWLNGVTRVEFEGDGEMKVFAGSMKKDEDGTGHGHFRVPTSVATDRQGRVYVADYMNDRIEVFAADGAFFKSLPVKKPVQVVVQQSTGQVSVFSWVVSNWHLQESKEKVKSQFIQLGTVEQPGSPVSFDLPLVRYADTAGVWAAGLSFAAELDTFAPEPTVWVYPGHNTLTSFTGYAGQAGGQPYWQTNGLRILKLQDGKLVLKRDLGNEAAQSVLKSSRVSGTNRNLAVNPKTGKLYIGDGSACIGLSYSLAVEVDPQTGRLKLVDLPFDAEQMAFDTQGLAYLRDKGRIVRYDPEGWREVPWDYGEETPSVGVASTQAAGPGMRRAEGVLSALHFPFWEHAPNGVFGVSARGNLSVPIKGESSFESSGLVFRKTEETKITKEKPYQFQLFAGRSVGGLVMVFDRHGHPVYEDAVPGLTYTHGVKIDKDDNLYAMVLGTRVLDGKPYYNPATCTLLKVAPRQARVLGTHGKAVPVPLQPGQLPKRPPDWLGGGKTGLGQAWVEGAAWFYGGVGYNGEHHKNPDYGCDCCFSSFDLDLFARSFAPEVDRGSLAVLDSNGNLILRAGTYGNVDDGKPLLAEGGPAAPHSLGGDEIALFYAPHVAVHTDRRLFVADLGNERVLSIRLGYRTEERIALKSVPEAAK